MGYTHYWYRPEKIPALKFEAIRRDFRTLIPDMEALGIRLGNGMGEGEPELTDSAIYFNGLNKCGHPPNHNIVIPWPTKTAGGVATRAEAQNGTAHVGEWFAGAEIDKRVCNGSCDYETFAFPRTLRGGMDGSTYKGRPDLHFDFCKTAFRPYDLAVTAFLVIAKHHMGEDVKVHSDGDMQQWFDAMMLCKTKLGCGLDFKLSE